MTEFDYYAIKQLEAKNRYLTEPEVFFENKVRRWYSKTFNTPLKETFNLCWDFILTQFYEANLENLTHNQIIDFTEESLPQLVAERDLESDNLVKELEAEQAESIKKSQSSKSS
jgi:hypothetical protein